MQGYNEPGFQDRTAAAKAAKDKALAQLRAKPPIDKAEQVLRAERQAAKERAADEKRLDKQQTKQAAKLAKDAHDRMMAEAALAAQPRSLTEAELKKARDARYAARKARQS